MTNKILFIHNRSTASFEPVDYFESLDTI
jgi:hypothetical protein